MNLQVFLLNTYKNNSNLQKYIFLTVEFSIFLKPSLAKLCRLFATPTAFLTAYQKGNIMKSINRTKRRMLFE